MRVLKNLSFKKCLIYAWLGFLSISVSLADTRTETQENSIWIRPSEENNYALVWGFRDGLQIRVLPTVIRGLISLHAHYIGQKSDRVTNFFAVEPIPKGETERGYSELEWSKLDNKRGKRIWSANNDKAFEPTDELVGASGVISNETGVETLSVYFFFEPFDNGAKVYVKATFYANNPYEVEVTTFKRDDSIALDYCIVTATMGNYARLRKLYLKDGIKKSLDIWPDYKDVHFTDRERISSAQFLNGKNRHKYFIAAPDEKNLMDADYAKGTTSNWFYYGLPVTQYWYSKDSDNSLSGIVSGRYTYWASDKPIPGGISIENFELNKRFKQGDRFVFGISLLTPEMFIQSYIKSR